MGRNAMDARFAVAFVAAVGMATAASQAQAPIQPPAAGAHADPPAILMLAIDSYSTEYLRVVADEFSRVVGAAPSRPVVYFELLDASRFEEESYLEAHRDWLRQKYAGRRLDLLVPVGEAAVAFLARRQGEPWRGVPVHYLVGRLSVDPRRDLPGATGVALNDHLPATLAAVATILPDTRSVVLIRGSSGVDRGRMSAFAQAVRAADLDLKPTEWIGLTKAEIVARVAQLPEHSVVFLLTPYVDAAGEAVPGNASCDVSAASSAPLFSLSTLGLECGGVGGLMRDFTLVGRVLAEQALLRLQDSTAELEVMPIARYTTTAFDARQLERWQIPESRLPAGSRVLFRPPNLWRDRRALVITAIAVTLGQALLIGGLTLERRRRRRAELEARRSLVTMAHLNRRTAMGELATSLAHELNQPLNAILQNAGAAQMMLNASSGQPPPDEIFGILEDIQRDDERAGEVIRGMRSLLVKHELDVHALSVYALVHDTVALVLPEAAARQIGVDLELPDHLPSVRGDRIHLQQVLLNLLLNGMEAVAAMAPERRHLRLRAGHREGFVDLSVEDHGPGIAPESLSQMFDAFYTTKGTGMGMGLSIARSIIEAHRGSISASNNPDGGATVSFSLPVAP